jgi:uncharacterized membrane protein YhfC
MLLCSTVARTVLEERECSQVLFHCGLQRMEESIYKKSCITGDMIAWSLLISGLIEIAVPFGIAFYLYKKLGAFWVIFIFGATMFMISLIRLPLNLFVQENLDRYFYGTALLILSILIPSLTAGLFEEGFRYFGYRYLFRSDAMDWKNGLIYGAGHGGAESILMGVNSLLLALFLLILPGILPPMAETQIQNMTAYMPFVSALERMFALCIQIGLSILVLQCFLRHNKIYLGYAIIIHTAVDFFALLAYQRSFILSEVIAGAFALFSIYIIWKFKKSS